MIATKPSFPQQVQGLRVYCTKKINGWEQNADYWVALFNRLDSKKKTMPVAFLSTANGVGP